jgi:hypothetical protein
MEKARHREGGCGGGFFASRALDGRPLFTCSKCGATWTNGYSGEPYLSQCRASGTDNGVTAKEKENADERRTES